ncbi:MAG: hypothetical protein PWP37_1325 [Thermotogota bacterium]|nr:hypothetical protein [Thermotogota bacterium]
MKLTILFLSVVVLSAMVFGVSVTILINPPETSIYWKDRLIARSKAGVATLDLPSGIHTLRFTSPGYAPELLTLEVSASPVTLNVELLPLAWLEVDSSPSSASVLVDDQKAGRTLVLLETSSGTHTLRFELDGYLDTATVVSLRPYEKKVVKVSLIPQGFTFIDSQPQGARVAIDGTPCGTTPFETVIAPGEHRIVFEKDGYATHEATFLVNESTVTFYSVSLIPESRLILKGVPEGALITFDSTPTLKREIVTVPGKHRIVVELPGYSVFEKTVDLKPGENEVYVELIPIFYEISVVSTPSAIVQVDTQPYAISPCAFKVIPGVHEIILMKVVDGKTSIIWKDRVVVATNTLVKVNLEEVGSIEVLSERVYSIFDGKEEFPVPTILHLPEGVWKFTAKMKNGSFFDFWVRSTPGSYKLVDLDNLTSSYINVITDTPGATVNVDGRFAGYTPLMGFEVAPGPHAITVASSETTQMKLIVVPVGENLLIEF